MARRTSTSNGKSKNKQRDWRTTTWYIIGAVIVATMIFSLVATAFVQ